MYPLVVVKTQRLGEPNKSNYIGWDILEYTIQTIVVKPKVRRLDEPNKSG
jgi:hypothetical protein